MEGRDAMTTDSHDVAPVKIALPCMMFFVLVFIFTRQECRSD